MSSTSEKSRALPVPCEMMPRCPICDSEAMTQAAQASRITICVCIDCGTTLSVPDAALKHLAARMTGETT